jgi:glycosyltransferase involved in cell wall biosynthesis
MFKSAIMMTLIRSLFALTLLPLLFFVFIVLRKRRRELIWGPIPILNNKHWSAALRKVGWNSKTLMKEYYSTINKREDFDLYFEDLIPHWIRPLQLRRELSCYVALLYIVKNGTIVHLPFSGGPLGATPLWRLEAYLFRWAKIRTVLIPYGADIYRYSHVVDPSFRNGLLLSYPNAGREEEKIAKHVKYWVRHADFLIAGFIIDGMGRWDVAIGNVICIDTEQWKSKASYSNYDGKTGIVRVLHAPNHRGVKGTEFLIQAVDRLRKEGLQVELVLLEKVPNDKVREMMQEVDILADQFICIGYGLAAVEGMASGLPVAANLEHEAYTRVFRRYSFLNECPVLSTSPETIKRNLRILVTRPELRQQLGRAGRQYVEKYHSYETAQYLFRSIYEKLIQGRDIDLMNLFHPLKSEYNRRKPMVQHPLIENRLPISEGDKC